MFNGKKFLTALACGAFMATSFFSAVEAAETPNASVEMSKAPAETIDVSSLSKKWGKVFHPNNKVNVKKITFHNRYGITLVADMYTPKIYSGKLPAIAVAGPYGAVKEQVSGRYAQELASRGFITIAFDPSFTGESAGEPRNTTSPDINTEDFCAAVDYLSNLSNVDANRIGILGICGWGGFALNAAAQDTRIKATVTSTMYDMSRNIANGYFDYEKDAETLKSERMANRRKISEQRTEDYKNGNYAMAGGVPKQVTEDMPQFVKDYNSFYQTKRGYHPRSFGSTSGATLSSLPAFMNFKLLDYADEIESAVLMIHGENAHSRYYSEDAFKKLTGNNKELLIIPGASHVDLYDNMKLIPFAKIEKFFKSNM